MEKEIKETEEKKEKTIKPKKERVKSVKKTIPERMNNHPMAKRIINIVFVLICILLVLTTIDVVCVGKFNKGPFFAFPLTTYKEGGKGYYGFGYKVIKYNQPEGKKTTDIGTWFMKYDSSYFQIEAIDLALQFRDYPKKTYKTYFDKYTQLTGKVKTVDNQNKVITISYIDPDGAYTTDFIINMFNKDIDLSAFNANSTIDVIGTISNMKSKTGDAPSQITFTDCFIYKGQK